METTQLVEFEIYSRNAATRREEQCLKIKDQELRAAASLSAKDKAIEDRDKTIEDRDKTIERLRRTLNQPASPTDQGSPNGAQVVATYSNTPILDRLEADKPWEMSFSAEALGSEETQMHTLIRDHQRTNGQPSHPDTYVQEHQDLRARTGGHLTATLTPDGERKLQLSQQAIHMEHHDSIRKAATNLPAYLKVSQLPHLTYLLDRARNDHAISPRSLAKEEDHITQLIEQHCPPSTKSDVFIQLFQDFRAHMGSEFTANLGLDGERKLHFSQQAKQFTHDDRYRNLLVASNEVSVDPNKNFNHMLEGNVFAAAIWELLQDPKIGADHPLVQSTKHGLRFQKVYTFFSAERTPYESKSFKLESRHGNGVHANDAAQSALVVKKTFGPFDPDSAEIEVIGNFDLDPATYIVLSEPHIIPYNTPILPVHMRVTDEGRIKFAKLLAKYGQDWKELADTTPHPHRVSETAFMLETLPNTIPDLGMSQKEFHPANIPGLLGNFQIEKADSRSRRVSRKALQANLTPRLTRSYVFPKDPTNSAPTSPPAGYSSIISATAAAGTSNGDLTTERSTGITEDVSNAALGDRDDPVRGKERPRSTSNRRSRQHAFDRHTDTAVPKGPRGQKRKNNFHSYGPRPDKKQRNR
ncbi:hypothetical protein LTR49_001500 [Elasticomyces elasticus]|nr:hypothetical protein LTR49_001500 [Elasticomyces elasticus]